MQGGSVPGQGGDQVAASDPNWSSYTQLAAGPGYSGLGQSSLTDQLRVLANGSPAQLNALDAALGTQKSSAPMGAGAEITINIVDGTPSPVMEMLQPQTIDPAILAADVAATIPVPIAINAPALTPEQQRQSETDTAVAAGTYNSFSAMGRALASGNLGDFWYHFAHTNLSRRRPRPRFRQHTIG